MKFTVLLSVLAVVCAKVAAEPYDTKFDAVDVDAMLAPDFYEKYMGCLLDRHPCDELATELKALFTDVLQTACAKCTPVQKEKTKEFQARFRVEHPEDYQALRKKYDPTGKDYDNFLKALSLTP